jgi:hypothetical protein
MQSTTSIKSQTVLIKQVFYFIIQGNLGSPINNFGNQLNNITRQLANNTNAVPNFDPRFPVQPSSLNTPPYNSGIRYTPPPAGFNQLPYPGGSQFGNSSYGYPG